MSTIRLINGSVAEEHVDIIVNAANANLRAGGGVCGAIFQKAGIQQLEEACKKFKTPLKDGEVVITSAFNMTNAKYIIHAVGPDFGRTPGAFDKLYDAYYNSFNTLCDYRWHSIAFPLISAGIFGGKTEHPAFESAKQCLAAYDTIVAEYPNHRLDVRLCAFSKEEYNEVLPLFVGRQ